MKKLLYLIVLLNVTASGLCQQPFEEYGYKVKVATLSNGKYVEFFDQDSLIQIGTIVLNRLTGKITHFVSVDTVYSEATLQPDLISRWISPDPHAHEYYSLSPYGAFANNPILFTDPDGRDIAFYILTGDSESGKPKKVQFKDLDKNFQKALSAFAKTEAGNKFLSQFAKAGDAIGDVKFKKDGEFSKHTMGLTQDSNVYGDAGRSEFTWENNKDGSKTATFYLMANIKEYATGDQSDAESMAVTVGHEAFLHIDQYDDKVVKAANSGNGSELNKIWNQRYQNALDGKGRVDHEGYLNHKSNYQKMYDYQSQLKGILNPTKVSEVMKSHDKVIKSGKPTN